MVHPRLPNGCTHPHRTSAEAPSQEWVGVDSLAKRCAPIRPQRRPPSPQLRLARSSRSSSSIELSRSIRRRPRIRAAIGRGGGGRSRRQKSALRLQSSSLLPLRARRTSRATSASGTARRQSQSSCSARQRRASLWDGLRLDRRAPSHSSITTSSSRLLIRAPRGLRSKWPLRTPI